MGPHAFTKILASIEGFCQAVPVGGSGAALDIQSSWRENSCDSDPGGGEQHGHRKTVISKHS